jgi:hypothetical protein
MDQPTTEPARPETLKAGLGLAGCVLIGFFVLGDRSVPLLSLVNLGFHELGHLLTYPFPDLITAAMGSVTQTLVPLGLAAYFVWRTRDWVAVGLCLAWAGSNAQEWAVYVADAPYERLELLGGGLHDWAAVLGRLNAIGAADEIAAVLRVLAWAWVFAGAAICVWRLLYRPSPPPKPAAVIRARPISWD